MHIEELGKQSLGELKKSFLSDHELSEAARVIDVKGPTRARKEIEDGVHPLRGYIQYAAAKTGRHRTCLEHNLSWAFSL